ncbi:MAG TPA: prepilin-type N-terminal cleavage/methylation domain-containing protein [Burkholderiales bacterium]|nr:prepilin-type N-terminal cleavage/methylation domain-containing protein [Burkholderiales bacterium]
MSGRGQTAGFTLVEVLVAIALMGILGVICWRGLDYVAGQRERIDRETDDIANILRVLSQIERDIAQRAPGFMLPPPSRPGMLPASLSVQYSSTGEITLEILRIAPPSAGSSRAQRIVYRVAESTLTRSASPAGTAWPLAPATDPVPLLTGAQRLAVRVYAGGFWSELGKGEVGVQPPELATGLEIAIEATDGARYVRIFAL